MQFILLKIRGNITEIEEILVNLAQVSRPVLQYYLSPKTLTRYKIKKVTRSHRSGDLRQSMIVFSVMRERY
ncbi:MAG TPA: hypothetical protein VK787_05790 [Puia sp.]|jgi:hypothetical protein|nr:hypothetical protein [Puia sp.]